MRVLVCFLLLCLAGCAEKEYPPTAEGRYQKHCMRCHEDDGSSATASKLAKTTIDLRDADFQREIGECSVPSLK